MADISFTSFSATVKPTAFGTYDADAQFQIDADKMVYHVQRTLGTPTLDAENDLRQIWTAFEAATMEYSTTINLYHARNIMLDMLGQPTGSLSGSQNVFPLGNDTEFARKFAVQYSSEIGTGGPYIWHTASFVTTPDQQKYNLWTMVSGVLTGSSEGKSVVIRKVYHEEPTAAYRFFDTTSVLNFLGNSLRFESYSPETIFYLLPIWEDVLRGTQLELNQRVRRSNYSFDLRGFELTLYPTPHHDQRIFFDYTINPRDPTDPNIHGHKSQGVVSNISNMAFGHLNYSGINSVGKNWIYRMTLALVKEQLGHIWSKYSSIPIPGGEVTLNGSELIARGREDAANLRQELREMLESLSYKTLMQERQELQKANIEAFKNVPMLIWISR